MGNGLLAIAAIATAVIVALLLIQRGRGDSVPVVSGAARERIAARLAQISDPAPHVGVAAAGRRPTLPSPQRRLWRDTCAALVVLGATVLVAVAVEPMGPAGAVLEATATPRVDVAATGRVVSSVRTVPAPGSPSGEPAAESTPDPAAAASPDATPGRTAVASPTPERPGPAVPTRAPSDRLAVLTACPGRENCYIYTVRRGDNLVSIAHWFGIPYATVLRLNPRIADPSLVQPGDRIVLPTPTR